VESIGATVQTLKPYLHICSLCVNNNSGNHYFSYISTTNSSEYYNMTTLQLRPNIHIFQIVSSNILLNTKIRYLDGLISQLCLIFFNLFKSIFVLFILVIISYNLP